MTSSLRVAISLWIKGQLKELSKVLRFIYQFKSFRRRIAAANVCGALSGAIQLLIALASIQIINIVVAKKDLRLLLVISGVTTALALAAITLSFFEFQLSSAFRERAAMWLEMKLLSHLQGQPYLFFKEHESSYLLSRLFTDSNTALDAATGVTAIGRTAVLLLGASILLPTLDPTIGLLILSVVPVYFFLLFWFHGRTKQAFIVISENTARASRALFESFAGIFEIKAFVAEKHWLRRYLKAAVKRTRTLIRGRLLMAAGDQTTQVLTLLISLLVIIYGAAKVATGHLSLGRLVGMNGIAASLLLPVNSIVQQALRIQRAVAAIDRIEEWLCLPSEKSERLGSRLATVRGSIIYDGVSFCYPGKPPVLREVNWRIYPGEVVLLQGPSGIGKTTLVNLLLRFLTPSSGFIYLDGVPLDELPKRFLRRQISYVAQDTFLFSDSVRNNISMGIDATDEQIYAAAGLANALDFIQNLPEGFNTQVGERGSKLSGGQRQRIAIARAILRNSPVLILDEATSAVDLESEALVHEAISRLMRDRTTIIIAHHSTVFRQHVHRSFVLENGFIRLEDTGFAAPALVIPGNGYQEGHNIRRKMTLTGQDDADESVHKATIG